ncbi:hypothetical protein AMTRI_Chr01g135260 [Amborella trichopoda]|uniref:DUF4408 domain-containing protein n=1 Tax=Amborella trichopoda TaxID=13333 RepID=W1PFY7_AMBTC|nr:uncharacterized protein LOC18434813 [Amborella trichopoda]ERN06614.1 hypothetical protein AMTR_s00058p00162150 [Amborella trichopoda]|eukprot:XP_006844939.1 uncharacterized protein LOC18434813 [Amborella trichopoda]
MDRSRRKASRSLSTKKRGFWSTVMVATFMLRRARKSNGARMEASIWKSLVSAMLPGHHNLQHNLEAPKTGIEPEPMPDKKLEHEPKVECEPEPFHDVQAPPRACKEKEYDSDGGMSCYASVENLVELDKNGGEGKEGSEEIREESFDSIDEKAEEFIAQFYEQMKLQRLDSMNRYFQMIQRSIG